MINKDYKYGDVIQLGNHRLLYGDCRDKDLLSKLFNGDKATMIMADPPYGMGKENEGVENDNLYRDKLDKFQMEWWKASRPHLVDNGSAYIWGWEDSLMSFYLLLRDNKKDRITKRNYIIWDKKSGQGISQETLRRFAPVTEHCLFFMLGEQGFKEDSANSFLKLKDYFYKSFLNSKKTKEEIYDVFKKDGRYTSLQSIKVHASYKLGWGDGDRWDLCDRKLFNAINDLIRFTKEYDELKKEYDKLKKEFYSTRTYFDNTHENMTDVWQYQRVKGKERWGHPTPKPVNMICRAIKSSCPEGKIVFDPFLGSGTTIVSAEKTNRICYGAEISEKWIDVIVDRINEYLTEPKQHNLI